MLFSSYASLKHPSQCDETAAHFARAIKPKEAARLQRTHSRTKMKTKKTPTQMRLLPFSLNERQETQLLQSFICEIKKDESQGYKTKNQTYSRVVQEAHAVRRHMSRAFKTNLTERTNGLRHASGCPPENRIRMIRLTKKDERFAHTALKFTSSFVIISKIRGACGPTENLLQKWWFQLQQILKNCTIKV